MLPTFKTKAEIPAGFETAYEEHEGAWRPKPDPAVAELAATKETLRQNERATNKLAADLQELRTKMAADGAGLAPEKLQALRAEVRKELETEFAPTKAELATLKADNDKLRRIDVVTRLAGEAGILPEHQADYVKLYGDEFEVNAAGALVVKGAPGKDPKTLVDAHKKAQPGWVAGTAADGGGAAGMITPKPGQPSPADAILANPGAALSAARASGAKS